MDLGYGCGVNARENYTSAQESIDAIIFAADFANANSTTASEWCVNYDNAFNYATERTNEVHHYPHS